jgi:hypothetical protein
VGGMSAPDWKLAPECATHWDNACGLWCKDGYYLDSFGTWFSTEHVGWGTERYIPRPAEKWQPPQLEDDEVNNPKHYQLAPDWEAIEVIQNSLTRAEYIGYLKGSFLKYKLRAGDKGDAQKCIDKANWYKRELNK